ncbi:MAG: hypothetical protein K2X27_03240 [Candidatus Obscuribacterales bacterium]|nr:hypothetical protein [Candidatus Obscuribacterales bacterium]
MSIQVDRRANRIVVRCEGTLDSVLGAELLKTVQLLQMAEDDKPIVIELSAVPTIENDGLRVLRTLFAAAAEQQAIADPNGPPMLRLTNISAAVERTLKKSGFTERLAGWPDSSLVVQSDQTYRRQLARVQAAFPPPVSDPVNDAYFVQSVAHALDRVDQFKTGLPYLGTPVPLDYAAARLARVPETMSSLESSVAHVADYLQGHILWGHQHTQEQVIGPSTIASVIGQMFGSIYNPNLLWDAYSHRVAQAEVELIAMCAALVGYDPATASGASTFGGTGTELYGVKIGIEKAQPGACQTGVRGSLKVITSDVSHYCRLNVASWLGLGTDSVITVQTDADNSLCIKSLEAALRSLLGSGQDIACIVATIGTTDAFGLDNLETIVELRNQLASEYGLGYLPHVHADAVIGWPWAVFNDYDFALNPLCFSSRALRSLSDVRRVVRSLHLADSIGLDFHKTGYAPIISSLFLCRDQADLQLISRDPSLMPYLYQFGSHRPGIYTLETSRGGGAILAAIANLKMLGKEGYRVLLGHIVTMAEILRARLEQIGYARIVNDANHGMVTLFRVYPDGVDANLAYQEETTKVEKADQLRAHNAYNRLVFEALRKQLEQGDGMNLGMTDCYRLAACGEPIVALKSFIMSPFVDEPALNYLITCIERARKEVRPCIVANASAGLRCAV